MPSDNGLFHRCLTTLDVHVQLRKLLITDYLKTDDLRERFRLNCRTDLPMSMIHEQSIEKILDFLEREGKFGEGNYNFIKKKVADVHVGITDIIQQAETRIVEIRENSLLVKSTVTDIEPIHLEKETREEIDLILLAVSEKLLCRSEEDEEDTSGLWDRYQDLDTLSDNFLNIWHTEYCICRKQHGRRLLLQYIKQGARLLEQGENHYDRFKTQIVPKLKTTLKKCAHITLHVFTNCGASLVSVVRSSVFSYWTFDGVFNLDKLWKKYKEEGLHVELQDYFNTKEALELFNVDRISLNITIQESDYLKYRQILATKAFVTTSMKPREIDSVQTSIETAAEDPMKSFVDIHNRKPTVKDPIIDTLLPDKKVKSPSPYGTTEKRSFALGKDVITTSMKTLDKDPVKGTMETFQLDPMESYVRTHNIKLDVKDPRRDLKIALRKGKSFLQFDTMKSTMYEINKRLSETPSVFRYLIQSGEIKECLYGYESVSLREIEYPLPQDKNIGSRDMKKIIDLPDEIFCTSDEYHWKIKTSRYEDPFDKIPDRRQSISDRYQWKRKTSEHDDPDDDITYMKKSTSEKYPWESKTLKYDESDDDISYMKQSTSEKYPWGRKTLKYDESDDDISYMKQSTSEKYPWGRKTLKYDKSDDDISYMKQSTSEKYPWGRKTLKYDKSDDDISYMKQSTSEKYRWDWMGYMEKGSRVLKKYGESVGDQHIRSTFIFLIGEPGCGKTTYCLNLLQKWCQREALQKFDYVFYVDLFAFQSSKKSIANLISSGYYGDIYNESHVDNILRTEKCLVLIDGDNHFQERVFFKNNPLILLSELYNGISELSRNYRNCVFVIPTRFLYLLHDEISYSHDLMHFRFKVIEILGLDEEGMTSFYRNINRYLGSTHETEEEHSQLRIKQSTFEKRATEDEPGTKRSDYFQKKRLEPNIVKSDSEEKLKGIHDYDSQDLNINRIKEMLEKGLCELYDSIMKIPILRFVCARSLVEGKEVPKNLSSIYLCLIDKFVGIYDTSDKTLSTQDDKSLESHAIFQPYLKIHHYVDTLCKLGKMAYDNTCSPVKVPMNYKKLEGYLDKTELKFSLESRILVPVQTMSDETCVRFVHKSIQDSLVAMYIVTEKYDVFESLCQRLSSVDVIIDLSHVILMICGLNHNHGSRITKIIKDTVDKDSYIHHQRNIFLFGEGTFIGEFYKLQLSWYTEYKTLISTMKEDPMDTFYLSDIYIDEYTGTETINKTITLISDKNVVVTSLFMHNVPTESGLSDTVLNVILAMNTSLESICIRGWRTKRSIEPLSIPSLRTLKLWNVHIQCTRSDDETSKSLLSNLPKLETLVLDDIYLNNVLLGLTSDEGRLPLLKDVNINDMSMGDQSIELAPDMKKIDSVRFNRVMMYPQGWIKFIKSLLNIHHDFRVKIYKSRIVHEAKEIVRRNENFAVESDNRDEFNFKRVLRFSDEKGHTISC